MGGVAPLATFFATPDEWRRWLAKNHASATELSVGFYRKGSGRPSITWPEAVDEALCFGWIDGVRRSIDSESYRIRFTPRRARSIWSAVNVKRVAALTEAGRMRDAGIRAFESRNEARTGVYSFEQKAEPTLPPAYAKRLRANPAAAKFFAAQPPSYRRPATWWVVSAKQEATRERRLTTLIADSAAGRRVKHLARPEKKR
jgi:uncharacterized protein YdeI (YjbR/CyaY-like superfamily)